MADNINVSEGVGKTVRTEDIGGIQHQVIKLALGASGAADMDVDSGQQSASSCVPVVHANDVPAPVGAKRVFLSPTITVDTSVYAANDCVGGLIEVTGALRTGGPGHAILRSIILRDAYNQCPTLDIILFDSDPVPPATLTDQAAIVFSTAISQVQRVITVPNSAWTTIGGDGFVDVAVDQPIHADSGTSIWFALQTKTLPDWAAGTDLTITFAIDQD